jgi:hypothetical protein
VLDAVVRLSTYDEVALLGLASSGALAKEFPFVPSAGKPKADGDDHQSLESLVEASPLPMANPQRDELIRSSIAPADTKRLKSKSA